MITRLTRAELEASAVAGLMLLLSAISALWDVSAGVKSDLSATASQQMTSSATGAQDISVNWKTSDRTLP
jgi:hypothetical protein